MAKPEVLHSETTVDKVVKKEDGAKGYRIWLEDLDDNSEIHMGEADGGVFYVYRKEGDDDHHGGGFSCFGSLKTIATTMAFRELFLEDAKKAMAKELRVAIEAGERHNDRAFNWAFVVSVVLNLVLITGLAIGRL